jgi:hypothetical protein
MPKRKFPKILKGVSCFYEDQSRPVIIFPRVEVALLEDKDGTYFFARWRKDDGYAVIPFNTPLDAVMFYQTVLGGLRKDCKGFEDLKPDSLNSSFEYSWEWIKSRIKDGEKIVQSFYNTNTLKRMFGKNLYEKIANYLK